MAQQIVVKWSGQEYPVQLAETDTVEQLKRALQERTQVTDRFLRFACDARRTAGTGTALSSLAGIFTHREHPNLCAVTCRSLACSCCSRDRPRRRDDCHLCLLLSERAASDEMIAAYVKA